MARKVILPKRITRIKNTSGVRIKWVPRKHISGSERGDLLHHLVFEIPPGGYVDVHHEDYRTIRGITIIVHLYPQILNEGGERVFPQLNHSGTDIYPNKVDVKDVQAALIADEIRDNLEFRLQYADGSRVVYESDKRTLPGGFSWCFCGNINQVVG